MIKLGCFAIVALSLASCATDAKKGEPPSSTSAAAPVHPHSAELNKKMVSLMTSPLADLNLVRVTIPPALENARKNPYRLPSDMSCGSLGAQVYLLDLAIGPDLDAPGGGYVPSWLDKGGIEIENAAVGALQRTVEGAVPFRNWIRKLSGADKRSSDLATSLAAGVVRRAYLKGLGQSAGCRAPAAPL
jgi:hypothetical protein